ncbi:MAG: hypothetical protein FJ399_14015, partial [Verrucomicrobia bacterium]|nr:hypothetical protein [Verrucomicrobiota bacterium]
MKAPANTRQGRAARHALALVGLVLSASLSAQSAATGTISGRVFNPTTGEYVRNAEVRIEGTTRQMATESDGTFQFAELPAGRVTVTVAHSGYAPVEAFTVTAGQTTTREINLAPAAYGPAAKEGVVRLDAFTVSSEREGNAKAIMAQKRSMNIATSVASDVFGDVAEGNVGEFLKFLPGEDVEYQDAETR